MSKGLKMINEIAGLMSKTHAKSRAALDSKKGHGIGLKPGSDESAAEEGQESASEEAAEERMQPQPGDHGGNQSPSVPEMSAKRKASSPIPPVKNSHGISGKKPATGPKKY